MALKKETTKNNKKVPQKSQKIQKIEEAQKKNNVDSSLIVEVVSIAILAFSLLLMLSIYTSEGAGAIGHAVSSVTKGLFGVGAYLIPIITIFVSVYILLTENKYFSFLQISMSVLLFTVIISFFHVLAVPSLPTYESAGELIVSNYKNGSLSNGGLFGAIFGLFFLTILGKAGTYVFLIAVGTVSLIILTGHSLINFIKNAKDSIYEKAAAPKQVKEIAEEKPITVDSMKHKKIKVYDAAPVVRKTKAFDYVVNDVERSSNEDEIHIIEGGKKITRDNLYRLKKEKVITIKDDDGIKSKVKPKTKPAPEPQEMKPVKEIKEEFFVPTKLNFDIITEEDEEDIIEEGFQDINDVDTVISKLMNEKPVKKPVIPRKDDYETAYADDFDDDDFDNEEFDESEDYYDVNLVEAKTSKAVKSLPQSAEYQFPSLDFLNTNPNEGNTVSKSQILENSKKLEDTLKSFGVEAKVIEVSQGPAVTRYELSPGQGVKVSKISGLADDLALNLAASGIRIEAPIPGKAAVGIEVPNKEVQAVFLREVIGVEDFVKFPSNLAFALGKDIAGNTVVTDIAKMPHLLIAGATGSGKSVCINTLITSIIYKSKPEEVKLLMVDPKVVELSIYNGIPHLLIPVVTDAKKAAGALNWAVKEMVTRYNFFAETSVRDLKGYNNYLVENGEQPLPQIVIIVDELADLMMVAQREVEDAICRLAQMARAAGLHLVIATQRPSVDVITGLIKANVPSRIAFSVSSGTDSRTILDMTGAEKLLGKGDMLFYPTGMSKPVRVQGAFISDKEVEAIVGFLKKNNTDIYDSAMVEQITSSGRPNKSGTEGSDELFAEAVDFIVQKEKASVSMLKNRFSIGYNRASRLMQDLEDRGFVAPGDGSKPRKVIVTSMEWSDYKERNGL